MSEDIPPLPNTPSWRGPQLKHRDNLTFFYTTWTRLRNSELVRICKETIVTHLNTRTVSALAYRQSVTTGNLSVDDASEIRTVNIPVITATPICFAVTNV
jgi:hypothetical protein